MLTLADIRARRDALEAQLAELLQHFEAAAGVQVDAIKLLHCLTIGPDYAKLMAAKLVIQLGAKP
jgi:hypothetical protein